MKSGTVDILVAFWSDFCKSPLKFCEGQIESIIANVFLGLLERLKEDVDFPQIPTELVLVPRRR